MLNNFLGTLSATASSFEKIFLPITNLINTILPYVLSLVGALGSIWCIVLGVKLAKAEEQQERDKAKNALKNAIIGFVLIFVLLATLNFAMPALSDWMSTITESN